MPLSRAWLATSMYFFWRSFFVTLPVSWSTTPTINKHYKTGRKVHLLVLLEKNCPISSQQLPSFQMIYLSWCCTHSYTRISFCLSKSKVYLHLCFLTILQLEAMFSRTCDAPSCAAITVINQRFAYSYLGLSLCKGGIYFTSDRVFNVHTFSSSFCQGWQPSEPTK